MNKAPSDERPQREGEKATQLTRGLWTNGDEHRGTGVTTSTVRTTLFRWLDRARAHYGELQRRRAPGGANGVETRMVAKFGTLRQAGEGSTREQSARRHSERVDTQAWHGGHAWSPRELFPQASLRPK